MAADLTVEHLRANFRYEPDSGRLYRLHARGSVSEWRPAGGAGAPRNCRWCRSDHAGASHRLPAEAVRRLRNFIAWMPA